MGAALQWYREWSSALAYKWSQSGRTDPVRESCMEQSRLFDNRRAAAAGSEADGRAPSG